MVGGKKKERKKESARELNGPRAGGVGKGGGVMGMTRNPPVCFCQSSFRVKL